MVSYAGYRLNLLKLNFIAVNLALEISNFLDIAALIRHGMYPLLSLVKISYATSLTIRLQGSEG